MQNSDDTNQNSRTAIAVLGATGFTGRLIAAHLARLNLPAVLAGRSAERLAALKTPNVVKTVVASPTQPATLAALCAPPTAVIINCVGPFTDFGEPVVKAAIEAGVHYLDITGEQAYMVRMIDKYHNKAVERGCVVVPACGFEYAIGNWAAASAAQGLEPLEQITVAVTADNVATSRGTQLSALRLLSDIGYGWQQGQRVAKMVASQGKRIAFPPPFGSREAVWVPFGELVTLPRHIKVQNVEGYMALPGLLATTLRFTYPLLPAFSTLLSFSWGGLSSLLPNGPRENQRQTLRWMMQAEASGQKGRRVVQMQGQDVYGLTADITVYAAQQILAGKYKASGVIGVAHAFDFEPALAMLRQAGVKITAS